MSNSKSEIATRVFAQLMAVVVAACTAAGAGGPPRGGRAPQPGNVG
jgi:hypothetical protein